MKYIYHCDSCHYSFEGSVLPDRCPDCGKTIVQTANRTQPAVRRATSDEINEFYQFQEEIRNEK